MRLLLLFMACSALLVNSGCRSFNRDTATSEHIDVSVSPLSPEDRKLAQAITGYLQARLLEDAEAEGATNALAIYQQAAENAPGVHEIESRIAVNAIHAGNRDLAIQAMETSFQRDTNNVKRVIDLAAIYQITGKNQNAIDMYEKALSIDPAPTAVYIALSSLYAMSNQQDEAIATLERGVTLAEEPAIVIDFARQQARRLFLSGALIRATPFFELVTRHEAQTRAVAGFLLSSLYLAQERVADAITILSDTVKLPDATPEMFVRLIGLLFDSGSSDEATEILNKATGRFPNAVIFPFMLGGLYADTGQNLEAITAYQDAAELAQSLSESESTAARESTIPPEEIYIYMAAIHERLGQSTKAQEIVQQGLELNPDHHPSMNFLAYTWAEANTNITEALQLSQRSLELDPDNGAYLDTLGWIYFRLEQWDQARDYLQRALDIAGPDYEIYLHLGDLHEATEDISQAIEYWKLSVAQFPSETNRAYQKLQEAGIDPTTIITPAPLEAPTTDTESSEKPDGSTTNQVPVPAANETSPQQEVSP